MSKTIKVESLTQMNEILSSSKIVVVDFWADWCGPCKQIAPVYEQLSAQLSRQGKVTFTKVDVDRNKETAEHFGITAMPTFMVFESGQKVETVRGADPRKLSDLVRRIAREADSDDAGSAAGGGAASSSGEKWLGASLPRGYGNATDQVDVRGLDLLNADGEAGGARVLFDSSPPSGLANLKQQKGKSAAGSSTKKDWVESDTDEQLMLYMPFQSTIKVHTLHITSLPPSSGDEDEDDDEIPMRPRTIRLYINRSTNMGFDEAEGAVATQEFQLSSDSWDAATGTARLELRFVKFQNVTSLVVFVVDGDGEGEKTRIDRIRVVGEVGEKREMGKLEKVGDDH